MMKANCAANDSPAILGVDPSLAEYLIDLGYVSLCMKGGAGVCGLFEYLFSGGLVICMTERSYKGRYCYSTMEEAQQALKAWDGEGDPPGAWIKYKSTTEERLGPGALAN